MSKKFISKNIIPILFISAFVVVFGVTIAANIFAAFLMRTMEFNYLSKPIEIAKLDEVITRWIPSSKKVKGDVLMAEYEKARETVKKLIPEKGEN